MFAGLRNRRFFQVLCISMILLVTLIGGTALLIAGPVPEERALAAGPSPLDLETAYRQALDTSPTMAQYRLKLAQAELSYEKASETARGIKEEYISTLDLRLLKYYYPVVALDGLNNAKKACSMAEKSLRLSVSKAFYDVLKAESTVAAAEAGLARAESQLKTTQAMFEAGLVAKTDVLTAEVGVANARVAVVSAAKLRDMAQMSLNQLMGVDLNRKYTVDPEADNQEVASAAIDEIDIESIVSSVLPKRLDVSQASDALNQARLYLEITGAYYAPNVWTVRQASMSVDSAAIALDLVKKAAELEIRLAHQTLLEAAKRYEMSKKAMEQAEENLRLANLRYESGVGTLLEIVTAEAMLKQVQAQLIQARYDFSLAKAQFDFVKEGGQLKEVSASSAGTGSSSSTGMSGTR